MLDYLPLFLIFAGILFLCFVPAFVEYLWPRDDKPLAIDLSMELDERYFAHSFRKILEPAFTEGRKDYVLGDNQKPVWLRDFPVLKTYLKMHRAEEEIWLAEGDIKVPAGSEFDWILIVDGNFSTEEDCTFKKELFVKGDGFIGQSNNLRCVTATGKLKLEKGTLVDGWIDSDKDVDISKDCEIRSRAASGKTVWIEKGSKFFRLAGEEFVVGGDGMVKTKSKVKEIVLPVIRWTKEMDGLVKENFEGKNLSEIKVLLEEKFGQGIPGILIFRRARILDLIKPLTKMKSQQKPEFLKDNKVWIQGAESVLVKGDIAISEGETVPYNIIVKGDLTSHADVVFQGGLHATGDIFIGDRNRIMGSIVGAEKVILGMDTVVENCVDTEKDIFVRKGVTIGTEKRGGGLAAGGKVYLEEGVLGRYKVYAEKGIQTVENIDDVLSK
ncbi:MAG TPA: hypothetical protein ENN38_02940 [Actinobacteria bacterium]|nr:hypothetical protein [Actinomycetota bacterium]